MPSCAVRGKVPIHESIIVAEIYRLNLITNRIQNKYISRYCGSLCTDSVDSNTIKVEGTQY